MNNRHTKSYWRVDAEYETVEYVENVSDKAPVSVWIQTIGKPYAYVETEQEAKQILKNTLLAEINRLNKRVEEL